MEQLERAERYLERMRRLYAGVPALWDDRHQYEDDVLSFFVHCYHIRDWIVALNTLGITSPEVDQLIDRHECLRICADLCNGTKHCRISRKLRAPRRPHIVLRRHEDEDVGASARSLLKSRFCVLAYGKTFDALEVAEDCIRIWNEYMSELDSEYALRIRRATALDANHPNV